MIQHFSRIFLLLIGVSAAFPAGRGLAADARAEGRARYRVQYATYLGGKAWDQAREVIVLPDG